MTIIVNFGRTLTDLAAWFGALGAVSLTIFEIYKYRKTKARLRISYAFDLKIIGSTTDGRIVNLEPDKAFWSITLTNSGGGEIIITQIGVDCKDTKVHTLITRDYNGPINKFTLKPGDSRSFTISNELIEVRKIKTIFVMDATQKVYKKGVRYKV